MTIKGPEIAFRRVLPLFIQRTEPLSAISRQIKFHSFHATAFAAITIKTTTDIYSKSSNSAKYDSVNTRFSLWGSGRRNLSIKATQVNDSGSIDSPLMQSMQNKIKENVNAESVTVKDAYGDGRHVSIDVVSSAFEGQSAVNRQRMVYKAIWEELQNTVHAVDQMTTRTPAEAAAAENS